MSALAQGPDGDLSLTNGNLTVVTDSPTLTAQRLQNRFRLFLGEWFLDTTEGIPYFQAILVKGNLDQIKALISQIITATPGVASITSLDLSLDSATRVLDVSFRVKDDGGATIVGGRGAPFTVEY